MLSAYTHPVLLLAPLLPVLLLAKLLYVAKHWVAGAMSGNLIQKPPPLRRSYYTSGHLLHTHNWSVFVEYLPCTRKIHML